MRDNFLMATLLINYWDVIIGNGLFGSTGYLEQIGESCVTYIMAESTEDNHKYFKRI